MSYMVLAASKRNYMRSYGTYKTGIETQEEAIRIARRLARRRHEATKVTEEGTYRTVWESYRPNVIRRE